MLGGREEDRREDGREGRKERGNGIAGEVSLYDIDTSGDALFATS